MPLLGHMKQQSPSLCTFGNDASFGIFDRHCPLVVLDDTFEKHWINYSLNIVPNALIFLNELKLTSRPKKTLSSFSNSKAFNEMIFWCLSNKLKRKAFSGILRPKNNMIVFLAIKISVETFETIKIRITKLTSQLLKNRMEIV